MSGLRLYLAFIPVLSETCSCWLGWTVPDSSLGLILPWIKLFRLENKDFPGRCKSQYPWQRHLCNFSFQPKRDFPNWSCSPSAAKLLLCFWLSSPSCSEKCTVKSQPLFPLWSEEILTFGLFPTRPLPGAPERCWRLGSAADSWGACIGSNLG